ncbi:MAG: hypothetical protein L5655_03260 [Thermosediminibacteraceae bacterium]|nr:hypothetical protein [Thermosediminibacteraceae bacterium]
MPLKRGFHAIKDKKVSVGIVLVIFVIFQLNPANFSDFYLDVHPHKCLFIFSIGSAYTATAFYLEDNRIDCPLISEEFYSGFKVQIESVLKTNSFFTRALPDSRKYILKIIPHYFYGSKYKEITAQF